MITSNYIISASASLLTHCDAVLFLVWCTFAKTIFFNSHEVFHLAFFLILGHLNARMWRRVAKPNYGKTGTGETLKKSFQLIVWRGFSLNQRFSTLRARNTRGSQIFKVLNVHWNDIFWPFFTTGIRQFLFYLTPMKKAGNTCSKAVFFNLFWFAAPLQSYVDIWRHP